MALGLFSGWRAALAELEGYLASPDPERVEAGTKIIFTKFLTLISLPLLVVFAVHYLRRGLPFAAGIMLFCVAANATAYLLIWGRLRRGAPPREIMRAFRVAALVFLAAWGAQHVLVVAMRGRPEYAPWVVLFPLLAVLVLGRRDAAALLGLYLAAFAGAQLWPGAGLPQVAAVSGPLLLANLALASATGAFVLLLFAAVSSHAVRSMVEVRRRLEDSEERARRASAELAGARDTAEAASRAKTEFLARMSHEIRTPMNAVLGTAELLLREGLGDAVRARVETINTAGAELLHVLDEIIDLARIESSRYEVREVPFDPGAVCRATADLFTPQAERKGLALTCVVGHEVPREVVGDPHRISQVLNNLVSNAVKFTARGEVALRVSAPPGGRLRFEVRDTGPGIAPEHRARIFEDFTQMGGYGPREHSGAGLGLAIARRLAEIMGGRVELEEAGGRGALFSFTVPLRAHEAPGDAAGHPGPGWADGAAQPATPSSPRRVLLAEDNRTNQELAREMLALAGCRVDIVADGRAAVTAAARGGYALVLMDCQMPVMDGYEATRLIREAEAAAGPGGRVPIVALTGHAMAGERERCLAAGMDDYLAKPFRIAQLHAVVERWSPRGGGRGAAGGASP